MISKEYQVVICTGIGEVNIGINLNHSPKLSFSCAFDEAKKWNNGRVFVEEVNNPATIKGIEGKRKIYNNIRSSR
jgi:hypothetical protein